MPITALDSKTALVVIDILNGVVTLPAVHPMAGVVKNCVRLTDAFREKHLPVVLVRVGWAPDRADVLKSRVQAPMPAGSPPPEYFDYIPELRADAARDILVCKRQWGAFYGTDLDLQLRRRGVTGIVLCGVATTFGVESTARDAWEHNYNLAFASDAMTDMSADSHARAMEIVFPRIGEIGTTDEILAKL